ncbi:MAG: hypothetical protein AAFP09_05615 [Cyanobacteria bacterium J06607_10]
MTLMTALLTGHSKLMNWQPGKWSGMAAIALGTTALPLSVSPLSYSYAQEVLQPAQASEEVAQAVGAIAPPANPAPLPTPFSPVITGITDLSTQPENALGSVGHLRPRSVAPLGNDSVDWLKSTILPLYVSPNGEHWGWIYQGWLIPKGSAYLAIGRDAGFAMVRSFENLYTFPVVEVREDGWFQVQYTAGGSAWAHTSQLSLGETSLAVELWEDRLTEQAAIYFLDRSQAQPLRSQPELANNMLSLIAADSLIEPLEVSGDWMRVQVTRPTQACTPLTGATVTEGWMRWRDDDAKALVWYAADGSCTQ